MPKWSYMMLYPPRIENLSLGPRILESHPSPVSGDHATATRGEKSWWSQLHRPGPLLTGPPRTNEISPALLVGCPAAASAALWLNQSATFWFVQPPPAASTQGATCRPLVS